MTAVAVVRMQSKVFRPCEEGENNPHLDVSSLTSGDGAGGGGVPVLPPAEPPRGSQSMVAATFIKGSSGSDKHVCRKFANAYLEPIPVAVQHITILRGSS